VQIGNLKESAKFVSFNSGRSEIKAQKCFGSQTESSVTQVY